VASGVARSADPAASRARSGYHGRVDWRLALHLAVWSALAACEGPPAGINAEPVRSNVQGRDLHELTVAEYARTTPPTRLDDWDARATELRGALWDRLGIPVTRPLPAVEEIGAPRVYSRVELHDLLIDGFEGMQFPALLYLPRDATGPVPAVLIAGGHDADGQVAPYIRTMCWRLANHGIAAMSMDWLGMGSRFRPDQRHIPMGLRSYLAGLLPQQPLMQEPLDAFEYLRSRPEVDPARVGIAGQSGGGLVTMYLSALDTEVAAAVIIDITVGNEYMYEAGYALGMESWGDPDSFIPGFHAISSHGELVAMIAPRPALVLTGDNDTIAPTTVAAAEMVIPGAAYTLHGVPDALEVQGFPTVHCWCEEKIQAAVDFFGRVFLGTAISDGSTPPTGSGPLAVLPADGVVWPDLLPPRLAAAPSPPGTSTEADAWRGELQGRLATLLSFQRRDPADFAAQITDRPTRSVAAVLWISDDGSTAPAELDRPGVWTVDLRPAGIELAQRSSDSRRFAGQNALQLGRSPLAYAVEDIVWASDGVRANGAVEVVAVCNGPQAAMACLAAGAIPGAIDAVVERGLPADFALLLPLAEPDPFGMYLTPGLGALASPDMLLAQIAPRALAIVDGDASAVPFTRALYEATLAPDRLRHGGDVVDAALWALGLMSQADADDRAGD
jgi:hypothetical protein